MSRSEPGAGRRPSAVRILGYVATAVGGFTLALILVANPLGIHPLDRWIHGLLGHEDPSSGGAGNAAEGQLWTCGMHPEVVQDHPGQCPICGMNLVPLRVGGTERAVMESETPGERKVLYYRNPMDPTVTSPVPMKDSMGMDYVPVYADEAQGASGGPVVTIDPGVVQNMGVTTQAVTRRDITRQIRTVGYLDFDQEKMVSVTTKYQGFVESVFVNYVGQPVRKGDPLFDIYSPELVQTEQELLSAAEFARRMRDASPDASARAAALVEAARERLAYWDITPDQVARLEESGKVFRTLAVTAPVSGLVMKRMDGLDGMAVRPGMDVVHIADLSTLWLRVEVFEDQLPWVPVGSPAEISLTYFPGEKFEGRVHFIEPEVSEKSRTVALTVRVPNPDKRLRAGMYATVRLEPVTAHNALVVPSRAVLRTGERSVVVVALGNGRFEPREVQLGPEGDGWVEVKSGLADGAVVVTSSQFLIDSESNLQAAIQQMIAARDGKP